MLRFPRTWLSVVALLLAFPVEGRASDPDPVNAVLLGAAATALPIAAGAGLLAGGRGPNDGRRLAGALALMTGGAVLGPSAGRLYAGANTDAAVTLSLRALTGALATTGAALAYRGTDEQETTAIALLILGGLPTALLAVADIVGSADAARESRLRLVGQLAAELRTCGPIGCPVGGFISSRAP